ncbi:MAG: hypothetical protein R2741_08210 [Methanolobus sp.]
MEKGVFYGLLLFFAGLLLGSSGNMLSCGPVQVEGLAIVESTSTMSYDENTSNSIYYYETVLYNSGLDDVYITSISIIPAPSSYNITFSDSGVYEINRIIEAGDSLVIEGSAEIDSGKAAKEELVDFIPILSLNISSVEEIPYFAYDD